MNGLTNVEALAATSSLPKLWLAGAVTVVFAGLGRAVRGVTNSGAVAGAIVCFALQAGAGWAGFAGLVTVFALTWMATRFGYGRKQSLGTAEAKTGRTAGQVLANLGVAAGCAVLLLITLRHGFAMAIGAALCEAAADTVSSEIGQAIGGTPRLITDWRSVNSGSDGAVTVPGTVAGVAAAILVAVVYAWFWAHSLHVVLVCAGAGIAGTIADSLLGATLERRGMIGNNAVNFLSTLIAAAIAFA